MRIGQSAAEDLLRSSLRDKAREAHATLTLDDVRRGASARRRHAGRRTAVLAAAAVLVAVGAPTAFLLRPSGNEPSPTPSPAPSATPKILRAIPQGRAPGITYLQDGTVHLPQGGGTVPLPVADAPVIQFSSYHGGWLVAQGAGGPGRVSWYDGTGAQQTDGPGYPSLAVSEDGTQTAYPQSGAIHVGITSGMGDGEQTVPAKAGDAWPIGFLRGGALVYQAGAAEVAIAGGDTLPELAIARAVSAEDDLVAGADRTGKTVVVSRSGHVEWTSADWIVDGFSLDGRYAAAIDETAGRAPSAVAILDAHTGRVVAQHVLTDHGVGLGDHAVMDVDGSLLVAATDANTLEQTILRLDRDGTVTRATQVFPPDGSNDTTYVVFAARP